MAHEIVIMTKGKARLDFSDQLRRTIRTVQHLTGLHLSSFEVWIMRELIKQAMEIWLTSDNMNGVIPFVEAARSFLLFVYDIDITCTDPENFDQLMGLDRNLKPSTEAKEWFKKRQSEIFPL